MSTLRGRNRRYHSEEALNSQEGEPTRRWVVGQHGEVGGGNRDEAFDTGSEPDNAHATESLLVGHPEAGECEAVEGMRRICNFNQLRGWNTHPNRGIVLGGFFRPRSAPPESMSQPFQ
ncbi:MAG: hypothetical protein NVS2B7_35580 [Herpetosiphon sp.]